MFILEVAADQTLPLRQINHQVCVYVQLKVERYVSIISLSLQFTYL